MAEVASSYPTAGGLYYWAAKLADESGGNGGRWSWFVGWFNLVGQVAVTAGIDFGLAFFTNAFLNLHCSATRSTPPCTILDLRHRPVHPRAAEHVRDPARLAPQRRVGVVARRRRRRDRPRDRRPQPAHADRHRHRLLDVRRQHRATAGRSLARADGLRDPALRGAHRPAQRAVHADRLRRLGPHVRGDPRRRRRPRRAASSSRSSSRSSSGSSSSSR